MKLSTQRIGWLGVGALWAAASGLPAMADDTELFVGLSAGSSARPNILFIVDNSGSMGTLVETQDTYNAATVYPSQGCSTTRVYWREGTGNPPGCGSNNYFNASVLRCNAAALAFNTAGWHYDRMARYDQADDRRWERFDNSYHNDVVECQDDSGNHGDGVDTTRLYAANGNNSAGYWVSNASGSVPWGSGRTDRNYTVYSGNYLNWWYGPTVQRTRLDVVKDVAVDLLSTLNNVNVGLMHFNDNEGGMVAHAMEDIATARSDMQEAVKSLTAETWTPLSETLYEAALYYAGRSIKYGTNSVSEARQPGNNAAYLSPMADPCERNFIVLLTDGQPTQDRSADADILSMTDAAGNNLRNLLDAANLGGLLGPTGSTCDVETYPAGAQNDGGVCLDDLADFLQRGDFSSIDGDQNVTTYTIGFTVDLQVLDQTAERGGGEYYVANDAGSLGTAFSNIIAEILEENTTFSSPTVAVNAFNRTQNLSDLFISVFRPSGTVHWPGNLKKYSIRGDATIVDADGRPAIDPETGFFADNSRNGWSSGADGANVEVGGAASRIPENRVVYTYLGDQDLTATSNRISTSNLSLTDALLGATAGTTREDIIDFINGLDPDTGEPRNQMGDPLHSQPASVVYGPDVRDGLVFFATNDGYLHALDLESGEERWAFVPEEFLGDQVHLLDNSATSIKHYGIDGDLRVQIVADNDNEIEDDEHVYLFFGMRRGGEVYYGLDVTDPESPQVLWRLDESTLPGIGQTWATPVPTRIDVSGPTQNADNLVLVLAGGYEPDQDNDGSTTDITGNSIYIVDSVSGNLLWHGSRDGTHKDFNVTGRAMDYSIPARVRVLDIDGDGYADRMYAADMGGQIWRFDITNGATAANLVAGGVIAQLGAAGLASPTLADTRRFYYAPDVASVNTRDQNFTHIGIGSGHREHPNGENNHDRFYALRDYVTGPMTQTQFNALTPIRDGDLTPVTTVDTNVPHGSPGWRLDLSIGGWQGEKVLAEARTFNNQVIFSSFIPSSGGTSCRPQLGINRVYQMNIFNGSPVNNLDGEGDSDELTLDDLFIENAGGILSNAQALFIDGDANGDGIPDAEQDTDEDGIPDSEDADADGNGILDADEDDDGDGLANGVDPDDDNDGILDEDEQDDDEVICIGLICFPAGFENNPVRTFWTQENAE